MKITLMTAATIGLCCCGYGRAASDRPKDFSDGLIVVAGAEDVRYTIREAGVQEVGYEVREDYPATKLLTEIRANLQKQGWRPLEEDLLNPGAQAFRGWGTGVDSTRSPERTVHTWSGQWEDKDQNVLLYSFRYECSRDDQSHSPLVTTAAAYWPKSAANAAKKAVAARGKGVSSQQP